MIVKTPQKGYGLKILPIDSRDFSLGSVFGEISPSRVPDTDFVVTNPLAIKDQGESDYCSAYALTAVSEDQEGIELLPEYQFFSTKRITGNPDEWGADLRSACASATEYGSVPASLYESMKNESREFILLEKNWPTSADTMAGVYKKQTYFSVSGSQDVFDNIRCALWQHRLDKSSIITGALWRSEWLEAPGGVIPNQYGNEGFGHAFKIFGQKVIDGELYLVAQLSQGSNVGDGGLFYLNRAVTNREIGRFGIYMLKDLPRKEAEFYVGKPFTIKTPYWKRLWLLLKNL